jgi:hypothetical protein
LKNTTSGTPAIGCAPRISPLSASTSEEDAGIAGTVQAAARDIEVQPVRNRLGDRDHAPDVDRIAGIDDDDLRRIRNIDMERIGHGVVNGPPRSARHGEIRDPLPRADIGPARPTGRPGVASI